MIRSFLSLCLASTALASLSAAAQAAPAGYDKIDTVVVIYAENRSFDNLYGGFPAANGLVNVSPDQARQLDRDGKPLSELPPAWGGLTGKGVTPAVTEAQSAHLPNATFAIDDPKGFNENTGVITHDLWHRFYQEQMQIDGGRNDKFVAWADSGALVMGHYDGSILPMWAIAKKYVLADNFFQGAFGGSFLNHFMLVCACVPYYPNADTSPVKAQIAVVEPDGVTLKPADNSPPSALGGVPKFANDGAITPDFYAVNTMQPPYQPSANKPAEGGDRALADPAQPTTLPPQHEITIGDLLSLKGISWAWYSGAWQAALDGKNATPVPNFQFHHQPFNYFAAYAPGTAARAEHIKDGGLGGTEFIKAIDDGKLPAVSFYKPQGNLNEHAGYADVTSGDQHLADLVAHLEKSPQWAHMLVVVTYDENGGFWDHVAPPKADRWGPGNRIPAFIISPYAKMGMVDHTQYDTTSILRFITARYDLPVLPGIVARDKALRNHDQPPMGDLTAALDLTK
ncbi:acid phosphatase [Mesorhizobium sp. CA18]|uniref:acid phosphatase n=1 Tax=unclassified Mesorhizobium TaxID=325217 RepID=UPI001CCDA79B|nr:MULTISPECIES: acid phosphatase [unclassified Mesorhizobium]MBZ9734136.1 acid phosphatase [Mesorhizobium sp. CA9]MBZ9825123.1 acid phosphatase [Mesorhizobium sp. CA18]MBZ9832166.1 acid phosphatase [Mesorhizobium sp. CA2]MBZ9836684.1 acid phosphatase [Mesorhizobium sp. CA3]MBZ9878304.1 acid phosphatase [Mesorhizobium sp. Ca11]